MSMNETGMNNPIFGIMSQSSQNMNNSGMNQGMGNTGMNMNNMNMGMNQGMGMNNMMNPGMGMNMGNMGNSGMGMNNMMNQMMMAMAMGNNNPMGMNMMNMANQMAMNNNINAILNGQSSNANNQNSVNQDSSNNSDGITVFFRKNDEPNQKPYAIQCNLTDRVSEIIQKYRNKSLDDDSTKKFIFNAKAVDPTLTAAEQGLTDQANIFVVTTKNVKGAKTNNLLFD